MAAPAPAPAPAAPAPVDAAAKQAKVKMSRKKLIIVVIVALMLLLTAGAGAAIWMKKKNDALLAEGGDDAEATAAMQHDPKHAPAFVAMEPFTVNLADREAERFAQISVTLELGDAEATDQIKAYMPIIRSNVLMVLAHKTSQQLLERSGKERLAAEILRESLRPLGYEIDIGAAPDAQGDGQRQTAAPKIRLPADDASLPVTKVHFANFIIQ